MIALHLNRLWAIACLWFTLSLASGVDLTIREFTAKNGFKWIYDYTPAQGKNTTVLLIHGFPGSRHDWDPQINDLVDAGYGVLRPDLLGFGLSDLPDDIDVYNRRKFSDDIVAIMDHVGLDTVVGVGHDWGAGVLSSLAVWYPKRFEKFIYLSLGYIAPGALENMDAVNKMSLELHGYMRFGYWYFFNQHDSAKLCQDRPESAFSLFFPHNNLDWDWMFADLGAARAWLTANKTTPIAPYLTPEFKENWVATFKKDGVMEAGMMFYKAFMRGNQSPDELALTFEESKMHVPVMTISGTQDMIGLADTIPLTTGPFVDPELYTPATVDAGHWLMFEQTEAVNSLILDFLGSKDTGVMPEL